MAVALPEMPSDWLTQMTDAQIREQMAQIESGVRGEWYKYPEQEAGFHALQNELNNRTEGKFKSSIEQLGIQLPEGWDIGLTHEQKVEYLRAGLTAAQEQAATKKGAAEYQAGLEEKLPGLAAQYKEVVRPGMEKTFGQLAARLGGQGLGTGGLWGSGAMQELAGSKAQELERESMGRAYDRLFGAAETTAGLGLQAAMTPASYYSSMFGRQLSQADTASDYANQLKLAQMQADAARSAARESNKYWWAQPAATLAGSVIPKL